MSSAMKQPIIDQECLTVFQEMKTTHNHKYALFGFSPDNTKIIVRKKGPSKVTYQEFLNELARIEKEKDNAYALVDADLTGTEIPGKKLIFIQWSPEGSDMTKKNMYTLHKALLKSAFKGVNAEIIGKNTSDVQYDKLIHVV